MFKMKYHPDGLIKRYKGRLVAKVFLQVYEIDYTKTFAPSIWREFLKIFLVIATILGMIILQIDVIGAYLETPLG